MPFVNKELVSKDLVAVRAKREAVAGVAETLTTAEGVLLQNFKVRPLVANHQDSNVLTGTSGNSKKFLNFVMAEAEFEIEIGRAAGSATAIPAVGQFLRCSGWDEYVETDHVRYQMADDVSLQDTLTIACHIDDRFILMAGCKGSSRVVLKEDSRRMAYFKMQCLYSEPTAIAFERVDYSAYARSPLLNAKSVQSVMQKGNDVVTHEIDFDVNADVQRIPAVNDEIVAHLALNPTLKTSIRMPKFANWNIEKDITDELETWIKWVDGTTVGAIFEMDIYAQYIDFDITDETPRKMNITHHPLPDATTSGAVMRFK